MENLVKQTEVLSKSLNGTPEPRKQLKIEMLLMGKLVDNDLIANPKAKEPIALPISFKTHRYPIF